MPTPSQDNITKAATGAPAAAAATAQHQRHDTSQHRCPAPTSTPLPAPSGTLFNHLHAALTALAARLLLAASSALALVLAVLPPWSRKPTTATHPSSPTARILVASVTLTLHLLHRHIHILRRGAFFQELWHVQWWSRGGPRARGVTATAVRARGGRVAGVWIAATAFDENRDCDVGDVAAKAKGKAVLMYIHGGGCVVGTPWFFVDHHALLVERFDAMRRDRLNGRDDGGSGAEGLAVFSPDYPLAPEHRHPAAVEAVFEAYCWLVDEVGVEEVFVGGDSAGGLLALQLFRLLSERGRSQPAAALLVSPWVDPRFQVPIPVTRLVFDYLPLAASQFWFSLIFEYPATTRGGKEEEEGYRSGGAVKDGSITAASILNDPLLGIVPAGAGPHPVLPARTLVVYGDREILAEAIEQFVERARRAGGTGTGTGRATGSKRSPSASCIEVVQGKGQPHDYQLVLLHDLDGRVRRACVDAVEAEAAFLAGFSASGGEGGVKGE